MMLQLGFALLLSVAVADQSATEIYAQPPETLLGCKCKPDAADSCHASTMFQCAAAPVCSVEASECAHGTADWSISKGYYDYCTYPNYQPYEALAAASKKAMLMKRIYADATSSSYPFPTSVVTGIVGESVMSTFDAQSDVMVHPRKKYIHSVGVTGGVRFVSNGGHPYTGLFKGADHGIIRLSSAKQPGLPGAPDIRPAFAPGMALKFLRDGKPSVNFAAMPSLDGQPCWNSNFFERDFSNHVNNTGDFVLYLIKMKFWQASYCPLMLGIADMASEESDVGVFPFRLVFHPLVQSECSCLDYTQCMRNLGDLVPGKNLFEVRAIASPHAPAQVIGHLTLTDRLMPSKFGDEQLFFKHIRMEDDFSLHPEWLEELDLKNSCGMEIASSHRPTIEKGCDSPFKDEMLQDDIIV